MPVLWTLIFCFFTLSCDNGIKVQETSITGKVIGIKDGDTIDILFNGKSLTVRLAHIDCPEKSQAFGKNAKQFTSDKCFGEIVKVNSDNKFDRNGRLIGVVLNQNGENINKELVKAGLAWFYYKYSTDTSYSFLEQGARQKRIGIWSETDPIPPWDYRKKSKKVVIHETP